MKMFSNRSQAENSQILKLKGLFEGEKKALQLDNVY